MKKVIFCFLLNLLISSYGLCDEIKSELNKKDKKVEQVSGFKRFIKNYVLPDENQIFKDKKHLVSIFGGYDMGTKKISTKWLRTASYPNIAIHSDDYRYKEHVIRDSGNVAISYSLPTKFWWFNGRFSFTIFSTIINQNIENRSGLVYNSRYNASSYGGPVLGSFMTYTLGGEIVQELIFGHPNLYFTVGLGVSYQIVVAQNAKTNNTEFNNTWKYQKPHYLFNNTPFNFVIKASCGHRFDNGMILELNWKHYSNGNLGMVNWGLNFIGLTIGYTF